MSVSVARPYHESAGEEYDRLFKGNDKIIMFAETNHFDTGNQIAESSAIIAMRRNNPNGKLAIFLELPPAGIQTPNGVAFSQANVDRFIQTGDRSGLGDVPSLVNLLETARQNNVSVLLVDDDAATNRSIRAIVTRERHAQETFLSDIKIRNDVMVNRVGALMQGNNQETTYSYAAGQGGFDKAMMINGAAHLSDIGDMDEAIANRIGGSVSVVELFRDSHLSAIERSPRFYRAPSMQAIASEISVYDNPDVSINLAPSSYANTSSLQENRGTPMHTHPVIHTAPGQEYGGGWSFTGPQEPPARNVSPTAERTVVAAEQRPALRKLSEYIERAGNPNNAESKELLTLIQSIGNDPQIAQNPRLAPIATILAEITPEMMPGIADGFIRGFIRGIRNAENARTGATSAIREAGLPPGWQPEDLRQLEEAIKRSFDKAPILSRIMQEIRLSTTSDASSRDLYAASPIEDYRPHSREDDISRRVYHISDELSESIAVINEQRKAAGQAPLQNVGFENRIDPTTGNAQIIVHGSQESLKLLHEHLTTMNNEAIADPAIRSQLADLKNIFTETQANLRLSGYAQQGNFSTMVMDLNFPANLNTQVQYSTQAPSAESIAKTTETLDKIKEFSMREGFDAGDNAFRLMQQGVNPLAREIGHMATANTDPAKFERDVAAFLQDKAKQAQTNQSIAIQLDKFNQDLARFSSDDYVPTAEAETKNTSETVSNADLVTYLKRQGVENPVVAGSAPVQKTGITGGTDSTVAAAQTIGGAPGVAKGPRVG